MPRKNRRRAESNDPDNYESRAPAGYDTDVFADGGANGGDRPAAPLDRAGADVKIDVEERLNDLESRIDDEIDVENTVTVGGEDEYREYHDPEEMPDVEVMAPEEMQAMMEALEAKYADRDADVGEMMELIRDRKHGTYEGDPNVQELGARVKDALGYRGQVRHTGDGIEFAVEEITDAEREFVRDVAAVSQAIAAQRWAGDDGRVELHRGVQGDVTAEAFAQIVEEPGDDAIEVEWNATEAATRTEEASDTYATHGGDDFRVTKRVPPEEVAIAIDELARATHVDDVDDVELDDIEYAGSDADFEAAYREYAWSDDEVVVEGGQHRIERENTVLPTGGRPGDGDPVSATEVADAVASPAEADPDQHNAVRYLIGEAAEAGVTVEGDGAKQRLQSWYDHVDEQGKATESLRDSVDEIIGRDPE